MAIVIGPVLYARPNQVGASDWNLALQIVSDSKNDAEPPAVPTFVGDDVCVSDPVMAAELRDVNGWCVWRWEVDVRREERERYGAYRMSPDEAHLPDSHRIAIPALGHLPRAAMCSCSSFAHAKDARGIEEPDLLRRPISIAAHSSMEQSRRVRVGYTS